MENRLEAHSFYRRFSIFYRVIFLCASVSLMFNNANAQELKPRDGEVRAVWIHTYGPFNWEAEMKKLADAGFNTVFVRVARGANTIYPSRILPRDEWAEPFSSDEMEKAIMAAHSNGLEFHAWKVCWHVGGASKQNGEAKKLYEQMAKDDRLVRDLEGKQAPFLNPADPRNQELELKVAREIVEKYNVDGIHLDYIRYPEEPHYDFDYGDVSHREFEKHIGKRVENWPRDVYSGALKWDYENWERGNINSLVQRVYAQTKQLKPRVQVSAAVWRAHRYNRATIKQDWILWANQGWLDFVVPMNYTTDDAQFRGDVKSQVANAAGRVLLVAGIGNYKHKSPEETLRQVQIARDEGADGYVLFDYKPNQYDTLLEALRHGAQSRNTYLPWRAPKVKWDYAFDLLRKDDASLYETGKQAVVELAATPSPEISGISDAVVRLETLDGRLIRWPGKIADMNWTQSLGSRGKFRFVMPPDKVRVVFAGRQQNSDGSYSQFVVRGPILEGVTRQQLQAELARLEPPKRNGAVAAAGRSVGVYEGGQAASGISRGLNEFGAVLKPASISALHPLFYGNVQVLILPQLRDVAELSPELTNALRDWVAGGGVLLLTHDAVGFRWHPRIFPEIGEGVALSKSRDVEVRANEFGISPGQWQHEYPDHVVIAPGPQGRVLAHEGDDATKPVLVAGQFGKGKVFLYGGLLGYAPDGTLDDGERNLLLEIVR